MTTPRHAARTHALLAAFLLLVPGCNGPQSDAPSRSNALDEVAESYVRLALAANEHDEGYVYAYFGPPAWRTDVHAEALSLAEFGSRVETLLAELSLLPQTDTDEIDVLRYRSLKGRLSSLIARVRVLEGEPLSFEAELAACYDAPAVQFDLERLSGAFDDLNAALPGTGPLFERYEAFLNQFAIPSARVPDVFEAALAACREQTKIDRAAAATLLSERVLMSSAAADQWVGFVDAGGSYFALYHIGEAMVRHYVESEAGGAEPDRSRRWEIFEALLSSPRTLSDLDDRPEVSS